MRRLDSKGFSLVELMVVTALMGLVVMAVYSVYSSTRRHAYTSEEVVEVQQNLRIALDRMAREVRLAGFLTPISQNKFLGAPHVSIDMNQDGDCAPEHIPNSVHPGCFSFRTASPTGAVGRLDADTLAGSTNAADKFTFVLGQPDMIDFFEGPGNDVTGRYAKIVRPGTGEVPIDLFFKANADSAKVDSDGNGIPDKGKLVLTDIVTATPVQYYAGDVVLPYIDDNADGDNDITTPSAPPLSYIVRYRLIPDPDSTDPNMHLLVRDFNLDTSTATTIASKVTALEFGYILNASGSEVPYVTDPDDISKIVAVRIRVTGATDATKTGRENYSGVKTRTLETLVKLRN